MLFQQDGTTPHFPIQLLHEKFNVISMILFGHQD